MLSPFFQVTVTRKIGDQTHTITHRKDGSGNEERHEDLVNIDDGKYMYMQLTFIIKRPFCIDVL